MTLLANDPLTQLAFSMHENKGVYALLLGSGLSRAASIPTGWEITIDLIRRVALAQGVEEQPDWEKWYKKTTGHEPNYSTLVEELASTAQERRSILHAYIEASEEERGEGRKVPTAAHHAIASLVRSGHVRVIVTTNFDRLMENALREAGVEPTIIASADALLGAEPLPHSSCFLVKLHGDYKDARILNTDCELHAYPPEYDHLLDRILDEFGLLVCGWSGEWDHALRAAFLRAPNRRYPVYWAARAKLRDSAQALVDHRRARLVPDADADSFFTGLRQRIETLEHSRRQNPLSIELLVSSTKRFLSKPEYRIQLEELLAEEADRVIKQLRAPEFGGLGNWSAEEFGARVSKYEAATEPLARMVGVLGRWGDDGELSIILDIIQALHAEAEEIRGGKTTWLRLRSYPAVLIMTSYGLSLVRAQRWGKLHELLMFELSSEYRQPTKIVLELYPQNWRGSVNDDWNFFYSSRRYTPSEYELLFSRFEILGAIAHLEEYDADDIKSTLSSPGHFVRMPVGRIGWQETHCDRLIREMSSEPLKKALLEAGFAKGNAAFLDLFVANLRRIAKRMSWG